MEATLHGSEYDNVDSVSPTTKIPVRSVFCPLPQENGVVCLNENVVGKSRLNSFSATALPAKRRDRARRPALIAWGEIHTYKLGTYKLDTGQNERRW